MCVTLSKTSTKGKTGTNKISKARRNGKETMSSHNAPVKCLKRKLKSVSAWNTTYKNAVNSNKKSDGIATYANQIKNLAVDNLFLFAISTAPYWLGEQVINMAKLSSSEETKEALFNHHNLSL